MCERRHPTDVESMAAAILSQREGVPWRRALEIIRAAHTHDHRIGHVLADARTAIDHIPYLERLRAERADALRMWLGAEAETCGQ